MRFFSAPVDRELVLFGVAYLFGSRGLEDTIATIMCHPWFGHIITKYVASALLLAPVHFHFGIDLSKQVILILDTLLGRD